MYQKSLGLGDFLFVSLRSVDKNVPVRVVLHQQEVGHRNVFDLVSDGTCRAKLLPFERDR